MIHLLIPTELIHQVYHTLNHWNSPTSSTCRILVSDKQTCDDCPLCLPNSPIGYNCGLVYENNPDFPKSLILYFQAHPESLV